MANDPRAGKKAAKKDLVDIDELISAYYERQPDISEPGQKVSFGTSGHRGSSLKTSFNDAHIAATAQAICEYRQKEGITGPLFMGKDTHALSGPAKQTALEVFAANNVKVLVDSRGGYTPTPAVSHAILTYNSSGRTDRADGVVVTPSHNPPSDGGFKYNPPDGGPAGSEITSRIQDRANELIATGLGGVKRVPIDAARSASTTGVYDYLGKYVDDLGSVINMTVIKDAGVRIGADPMGGASVAYWSEIASHYGLDLTVVNDTVDPQWGFMSLDWDGKIRMDCSSPYAMASLVSRRKKFDISTGNDADADRHGIVTPDAGLMNPNHYLAVAIKYLFENRPDWPRTAAVGKTLVSSSMIDRVAEALGRRLVEVPVGFKWFVPGLLDGSIGFGGEESAGASFLRRGGKAWTTDKDGIILCLLASEIKAVTGKSPSELYTELTEQYGAPAYARIDAAASPEQKAKLSKLNPGAVAATELAGEPIIAKLTDAPGNKAPIGGLKVATEHNWFAARPSGTEDVYKIYAESFKGEPTLKKVQAEAKKVVDDAIG
ncbi:phosphoglucomutase (alpha-D-glucose-1,6-bisphosphate-dependent) [Blastococcus sp. Marseille-P5729]|uniref:phosphoglucomutase (alpha-D-glucose-1,6-bisphosphate-dependent) n=1 Tax=Blastococcus sp. Marseille-P5729 TaxID=2086582 RepID=UPI000D111676|nr:phosphoglucomutase (alpha-D-glucose-1,6-bisphosphate-dependent) [Blastococcus sp. Marseille-P5729]